MGSVRVRVGPQRRAAAGPRTTLGRGEPPPLVERPALERERRKEAERPRAARPAERRGEAPDESDEARSLARTDGGRGARVGDAAALARAAAETDAETDAERDGRADDEAVREQVREQV